MPYKVVVSKTASKAIYKYSEPLLSRMLHAIKNLETEPRPPGCKMLKGNDETLWRIRVGDYRIIYSIDEAIFIVDIREVGHRSRIYK